MREIDVEGQVVDDLPLEGDVRRIDARVLVIATEDPHAAAAGERITSAGSHGRGRRHYSRPDRTNAGDRLLLHAVGRDRADLRKHVLARVEDAVARAEHRFAVMPNVPR